MRVNLRCLSLALLVTIIVSVEHALSSAAPNARKNTDANKSGGAKQAEDSCDVKGGGPDEEPDISEATDDESAEGYSDRARYPFMVRVEYDGKPVCGASLVTKQLVLTAAHCAFSEVSGGKRRSDAGFDIVLGDIYATRKEYTEQRRKVAKVILHKDYQPAALANDIALFVLDQPVKLTPSVQTIKLSLDEPTAGTHGTIAGWGLTSNDDTEGSYVLKLLDLNTVGWNTCKNTNDMLKENLAPGTICAASPKPGEDRCLGDDGGPLFAWKENKYVQMGLVSWGAPVCATPNFPSVYTSVSYFYHWIKCHMNKHP